MRFSQFFGINLPQAMLDFVDIDTSVDTRLFIDPYAISIREDDFSLELQDYIVSFFTHILDQIRSSESNDISKFTSFLREPNETFLGMSKGAPSGRGVGVEQASSIISAFRKSKAFETGLLVDLAEAELYIDGISSDKISDITTNIIRSSLVRYTQEQCKLHSIPMIDGVALPPCWNIQKKIWESQYHLLPIVDGKPVVLVPKVIVRRKMSLDSQEMYNHHMINYLQSEYESSNSGLVKLLRDGTPKVFKKDVKEKHPFSKDNLAEFVKKHPQIIETYKSLKGAKGPLEASDFDENFDERMFASSLINEIPKVLPGNDSARKFHSLITGILTFLFYPEIIFPIEEHPINEGRKRIDIIFTNAARDGFFLRRQTGPQTHSAMIIVECKNYGREIGNPEIDQLLARFGHQRGKFGILVCRSIEDRETCLKRCRDAVQSGLGYVLVLDDADICEFLRDVERGQRRSIEIRLEEKFTELIS